MKHSSCILILLVLFSGQAFSQTAGLSSPNGKVYASIKTGHTLDSIISYRLFAGTAHIVENGTVGLQVNDVADARFTLTTTTSKRVSRTWQPVYGENKSVPENYNQRSYYFTGGSNNDLKLLVTCRVYNEGFAFQYRLIKKGQVVLTKELSKFALPGDATAWISTTAQGVLQPKKVPEINALVERPLTVQLPRNYIALGEAALVDYARMKFARNDQNEIVSQLDGDVQVTDTLLSPWRYVLVARSPADLLEKNYLLLNLNEPNKIADTKWIQPGTVLREATLTTTGAYNSIDFASTHNIKYILFDAGWYGREDADTSDATRVSLDPLRSKGPLDLQKVIAYGKQKNVGIILYVNRRALERQLDTLMPLYESWGIKGVKFGFVQVGSQAVTSWLHKAVRKAAQHHILVDIHDEYRPTGYSRTYPNLLTQEGIRGDEESIFTEHSITTLFTRMIAGAADNTNCYFTARVNKMSSHAAQLAKAVCIYSPWQFLYWYDRPVKNTGDYREGEIREVPELKWFNTLPVVWDKTRVLEGDMTRLATIARKKNNNWYVGSLNGTTDRTLKLPLTFLDKNKKYMATIYTDDANMQTYTNVAVASRLVDRTSVLSFDIKARNGVAIHLEPAP